MRFDDQRRWWAKLAAWIHDPAEKALVLLRDPAGHEGGTSAKLSAALFGEGGLDDRLRRIVRRADHWASGADRPEFPRDRARTYWEQVRFHKEPVLIHPLSGAEYRLQRLDVSKRDLDLDALKRLSFDHFERWIVRRDDGSVDAERTFLSFWRFGPESPNEGLGALWGMLPADTRLPEHTIWDHLRLCSALAGAMAADPNEQPALLSVALGPVQRLIAQARSSSDLWAGSHLLSRLAWEAMCVVCERCGPDAVVLPDLRRIPLVDLWLAERLQGVGAVEEAFEKAAWRTLRSDVNPLFAAALPNRFMAIVAADEAQALAEEIEQRVRSWVRERAREVWQTIAGTAGEEAESATALEQIEAQLAEFPEVHWSAVAWSLIEQDPKDGTVVDTKRLREALALFYPEAQAKAPGLLGHPVWRQIVEGARWEQSSGETRLYFFRPRPGQLYGALHALGERVLAAAKATRRFEQLCQEGIRCSLCGEREWLTTDREALHKVGRSETVWDLLAKQQRVWVREGERLCALCALKRLWPTLFVDEVRNRIDVGALKRYVVSTHTMALVPTLRSVMRAIESGEYDRKALEQVRQVVEQQPDPRRTALPYNLDQALRRGLFSKEEGVLRRLPSVLDALDDLERAGDREAVRDKKELIGALVRLAGERAARPEAYYAIVIFDGDRMGAWLSATGEGQRPRYEQLWHPKVREAIAQRFGSEAREAFDAESPPPSPAWHGSISRALSSFALTLAPWIVERTFAGKLLYAGGDDLLALVALDDLLPMLASLRRAYSGTAPRALEDASLWRLPESGGALLGCNNDPDGLEIGGGHVWIHGQRRLVRTMGSRASCSCGVVIAHHMTPWQVVLDELRAAERRAKDEGGRDALSVTLIKRAGGATHWTTRWGLQDAELSAIELALRLVALLRTSLSRRAAYALLTWIEELPSCPSDPANRSGWTNMLEVLLVRTLMQHRTARGSKASAALQALAGALARFAERNASLVQLRALIIVAEFLAREARWNASNADGDHDRRECA